MKNNSLDDIIKCNIEISSPASNDETFDTILLVVAAPLSAGSKTITKTISVSSTSELTDYGYTSEEPAYIAADVAFSQSPAPDSLYITVRQYKNAETSTYETIDVTLNRAASEANFYGIHLTEFKDSKDVTAAVSWAESNNKLYGFEYTDENACPIKNFSYYRSFGIYSGDADGYEDDDKPTENDYMALAWMAKCFGYDPGTETWHLKELSTVVPSALDTTQKSDFADKNINTYLRYAGCNVTIGGYTLAGEWIDVIRFRDWLKAEMQTNVFNALKVNRKVPFTDAGIGLIQCKMEETLLRGQSIGGIADTEYDDDDNAIPGYTVTVPKASDLTEAERKSRKLTGCKYVARLAGAIHAVEIEGYLEF